MTRGQQTRGHFVRPRPRTRVCWCTLGSCLACPPWLPCQASSPSSAFTQQEHGLQEDARPLGGGRAGPHDSTGPITAPDYPGSVIGLEGGHVTQQTNQSASLGRLLQRGERSRPPHPVVVLLRDCRTLGPSPGCFTLPPRGCHPPLKSPRETSGWEPRTCSLMPWVVGGGQRPLHLGKLPEPWKRRSPVKHTLEHSVHSCHV